MLLTTALGFAAVAPAIAAASPAPVEAYYIYGTSASAVESSAYNDGCAVATAGPHDNSLLILDFGAARVENGSDYYTDDYSNYLVSNPTILTALESASNGFHDCYTSGSVAIAYGTSNDTMAESGMTDSEAEGFGDWQSLREDDLASYIYNNGRTSQSTAIGVDMEPGFDPPAISKELVTGASEDTDEEVDFDYGSADGCPQASGTDTGSCSNGWSESDVAYASFDGSALPIPEIYYSENAVQWANIQDNWNANHPSGLAYIFAGLTAEAGSLAPGTAWSDLVADANSGTVDDPGPGESALPGIICFGSC